MYEIAHWLTPVIVNQSIRVTEYCKIPEIDQMWILVTEHLSSLVIKFLQTHATTGPLQIPEIDLLPVLEHL